MDRTARTANRTRISRRNDDIMSFIGKGNHLVKDAIRGRRGERARTPEMVDNVHDHRKNQTKPGASTDHKTSKSETHTPTSRTNGMDTSRSGAANRPPSRRKKTKHVDELILENGTTFHCSLCMKVYQSLRAAREHIKLKHNEVYKQ